ncbi:MAG: flagellar hook-associated protein FlgK, partial [Gammaproteobacteria bacterium]|nr:flagellar hook-associated protein FlgK [Gammaproteobacteria bacterium]
RFHQLDARLDTISGEINGRLKENTAEINAIADSIAEINLEIITARQSATGVSAANDLLDKRDQLVNELGQLVNVQTVLQEDGAMNIFVGNGQSLVLGTQANKLVTVGNNFDPSRLEVAFQGTGVTVPVSNLLTGGELGGALEFRDGMLEETRNAMGRIATVLTDIFNSQHREGMDLNGQLGGDFFSVAGPAVLTSGLNTGSAAITATAVDSSALTTADYELRFDGAVWSLLRTDNNTVVPMTGSGTGVDPFLADGLSLVVSGAANAGDAFLVQPTASGAETFSVLLNDTDEIAAAAPIRAEAAFANTGSGTITPGEVIDVTDPNLLTTATIQFLTPGTYSINGSGSFAYAPGTNIDINGSRVVIEGAPQTGDVFTISANTDGSGDNRNALLVNDLRDLKIIDGGNSTLDADYNRLVTDIGLATQQASINRDAQGLVRDQAIASQQSVSGVNLEEEAANMLRFQQSFQAAAQMITVADTLFQTLLGAVRR